MNLSEISVVWRPRRIPLTPAAVAGQGTAAVTMARRLLAREEEALARLKGAGGKALLVLLGESDTLPWSEGVVYLGHDPSAPALLLPTTHEPSVPLPLLERALRLRFSALQPPIALLPGSGHVLSLAAARAVSREILQRWLEENA